MRLPPPRELGWILGYTLGAFVGAGVGTYVGSSTGTAIGSVAQSLVQDDPPEPTPEQRAAYHRWLDPLAVQDPDLESWKGLLSATDPTLTEVSAIGKRFADVAMRACSRKVLADPVGKWDGSFYMDGETIVVTMTKRAP